MWWWSCREGGEGSLQGGVAGEWSAPRQALAGARVRRKLRRAVRGVADDGVADVGTVDAELVGAAGFGGEFEEGVGGAVGGGGRSITVAARMKAFEDGVDGLGGFADVVADGVFFADFGMDGEG